MSQDVKLLPAPGSALLEGLLQIADEGVLIHDAQGQVVYCNPSAERILGLEAERLLGQSVANLDCEFVREDASPLPAGENPVMQTLRTGEPCTKFVVGFRWNPETPRSWVSINSAIIPSSPGEPLMAFAIFEDITDHIDAKRQLAEMAASLQQINGALTKTEALMRNLLQAIPDQVWLKDLGGVYLFCNASLARVFQATESEVVGKTDYDFLPAGQADQFRNEDVAAARGGEKLVVEHNVAVPGYAVPAVVETIKVPVRNEDGRLIGVLGISRDITERRELEQKLRQSNIELQKLTQELQSLARTDPLTGLPNRRAFEEAIGHEFQRFKRLGSVTSVLVIDIDHFKLVNDTYGHDAGDTALLFVTNTFREHCRTTDLAARLGGEEFALLLPGTATKAAVSIAERLKDEIERSEILFGSSRFALTVSIGISSFRRGDAGWPQVISRADAALYEAKEAGRNKVRDWQEAVGD